MKSAPQPNHTHGHLVAKPNGSATQADINTVDGTTIATTSKANARRLAAAWNTCEGLTTENLESVVFMGETMLSRVEALKADADKANKELTAARALLREVLSMNEDNALINFAGRPSSRFDKVADRIQTLLDDGSE